MLEILLFNKMCNILESYKTSVDFFLASDKISMSNNKT